MYVQFKVQWVSELPLNGSGIECWKTKTEWLRQLASSTAGCELALDFAMLK